MTMSGTQGPEDTYRVQHLTYIKSPPFAEWGQAGPDLKGFRKMKKCYVVPQVPRGGLNNKHTTNLNHAVS